MPAITKRKATVTIYNVASGEPMICEPWRARKLCAEGDWSRDSDGEPDEDSPSGWTKDNLPSETAVNKMKAAELNKVIDQLELSLDLSEFKKIGDKRSALNAALVELEGEDSDETEEND